MKLPNCEHAYVPRAKLEGYLLALAHPVGGVKARFFRSLGFHEGNTHLLEQELLMIAAAGDVEEIVPSPHGTKYVVDGRIRTPGGRVARVRTVWVVDVGREHPRLVTAYPRR